MDLLFLGTSSGTPTKTRNVSGLALIDENSSNWTLVDCGEGTQHQVLHSTLSLADLQAIFITHVHGDHCYGLPGLIASAGMQARRQPLKIIGPAGIEDWMRATQQLTQLTLPYALHFIATESLVNWSLDNWVVDAIPLSHRVPSFAYRFIEARREPSLDLDRLAADGIPQGPIWGQLRSGVDVLHEGRIIRSADYVRYLHAPRCIVVGGDNDRPALLRDACLEAQVLVHEATYTKDVAEKVGAGTKHSTADAVASFAQSVGLPNLILTHFSARYQSNPGHSPSIDAVRAEAERCYRGQLFLADDFARYRLNRAGKLTRVK